MKATEWYVQRTRNARTIMAPQISFDHISNEVTLTFFSVSEVPGEAWHKKMRLIMSRAEWAELKKTTDEFFERVVVDGT